MGFHLYHHGVHYKYITNALNLSQLQNKCNTYVWLSIFYNRKSVLNGEKKSKQSNTFNLNIQAGTTNSRRLQNAVD